MKATQLDVRVESGTLRVLTWGTGKRIAIALHGITGSAMSWQAVARRMPDGWTLAAPDLRGRGFSGELPPPFGIERHISDITAVLRRYGGRGRRPVLLGHSLGAYLALLTRDARPGLASKTVLVDGGLPLPLESGSDPDEVLNSSIGPAMARLGRVFADQAEYVGFWRGHPALAEHWNPDIAAYAHYDALGASGVRSRVREEAVRADGRDLLLGSKRFGDALERLPDPTPLLTAPMGMFGEPPGIQPPELVQTWHERAPRLRPLLVPDVNHYTILFSPQGAAAVAKAIVRAPARLRGLPDTAAAYPLPGRRLVQQDARRAGQELAVGLRRLVRPCGVAVQRGAQGVHPALRVPHVRERRGDPVRQAPESVLAADCSHTSQTRRKNPGTALDICLKSWPEVTYPRLRPQSEPRSHALSTALCSDLM